MGPDGLATMLGKDPLEMLLSIGYEVLYIYEKVKAGFSFELVVFPEEGAGVERATWQGASEVICKGFPNVASIIQRHLPAVIKTPFKELHEVYEATYKTGMYDARGAGRSSPAYITADRLAAKGDPAEVRAFMYHSCGLNYLYAGDGFTYLPTGQKGVPEFMIANVRRSDLHSSHVNVALGSPPLKSCMEYICAEYTRLLWERHMF